MAKKIKVLIDNGVNINRVTQSDIISNNPNSRYKVATITLSIILFVSIFGNFIQFIDYSETSERLESSKQEIDYYSNKYYDAQTSLSRLIGSNTVSYIEKKLNFMDTNVYFQIEGYGKYYYTYDCMIKKVGNKKYRFLAFNEGQAKAQGFKKDSC